MVAVVEDCDRTAAGRPVAYMVGCRSSLSSLRFTCATLCILNLQHYSRYPLNCSEFQEPRKRLKSQDASSEDERLESASSTAWTAEALDGFLAKKVCSCFRMERSLGSPPELRTAASVDMPASVILL